MRNNRGFVLVDLLMDGLAVGGLVVVLALMGIQSALAFPRWSESRDASLEATLRLELQNVVAQQALHRADHRRYATSLEELGFEPSPGVAVRLEASAEGWSASATHEGLGDHPGCAVSFGAAAPPTEPMAPPRRGEIVCGE